MPRKVAPDAASVVVPASDPPSSTRATRALASSPRRSAGPSARRRTAHGQAATVRKREALETGPGGRERLPAQGTPPEQLADGIRAVAAGEALLAATVTRRLIEEFARVGRHRATPPPELEELTPRELEVLHVLGKLGLRDRVQAVVLAYESGLVTPGG
jgi:DNA-binding NarL/FixJ family response regulator